jgi:hypothetical protein
MASKLSKSKSSPSPAKHIDKKGVPTHSVSGVPGYKDAPGTPKWVSGPAKAAAKKAK